MIYRASAMPTIMRCGQSRFAPVLDVEEYGEAAETGTLVHAMIANYLTTGSMPERSDDEARMLFSCAVRMWRDGLAQYFPAPMVEQHVTARLSDDVELSGHIDVASIEDDFNLLVLDWKTGRKATDYSDQLEAYAVLLSEAFPQVRRVVVITAWVRELAYDTAIYEFADLQVAKGRIRENLTDPEPRYVTGDHCVYCKRAAECPARRQLSLSALVTIGEESIALREMQCDSLRKLIDGTKILEKALRDLDAAIRNEIQIAGPLYIGEGQNLELVDMERREVIDGEAALNYLLGRFGDETLRHITVTASAIDSIAKASAGETKGAIKANIEDVNRALRNIGAMGTKTVKILKRVKVEGQGNE